MHFAPTSIADAFVISTDLHADERGWFARSWCREEFAEHGLPPLDAQANLSFNLERHTLRGMHWQQAPSTEAKLVRPVHGAIWDVLVDLRPGSTTFGSWFGATLRASDAQALLVPAQCAHGFLTLEPHTLVHYHMGDVHKPDAARGFRWDDPAVGIDWPAAPLVIGERDAALPLLADALPTDDVQRS